MTVPDFFLIGAPKCGTTSLASWLAEHSQVFMCTPKEPFFFCTDIAAQRAARSWNEYVRLFDRAVGMRAVGEASTSYLRSREAVPAILRRLPSARFVICLRNPVDMVASVHGQMLRGVREDQHDLAAALALEPDRRRGLRLPPGTHEPADLIYTETCALGSQLARLYERVDRDRVHLVFLDDLAADPRRVWIDLQAFLRLDDDGRSVFGTENARAVPRLAAASRILRGLHRAKNWVLPGRSLGFGSGLARALERAPTAEETAVPPALRLELARRFAAEIDHLEHLTGRDLSAWRLTEEAA